MVIEGLEHRPNATDIAEALVTLPIKRVMHPETMTVREVTKLPREVGLKGLDEGEVVLKIVMAGINYMTDFEWFRNRRNHDTRIVPGNKIIGKIVRANGIEYNRGIKHLLFPYSNCILQNIEKCDNCKVLESEEFTYLNKDTYNAHEKYACLNNLVHGRTINGGLQDYIKIRNPEDCLIEIPEYISMHDSCFFLDIALPFYIYLKENPLCEDQVERILIILNDISKEINDILIVLKHFKIDKKNIHFLDHTTIKGFNYSEKQAYKSKFNRVLIYDELLMAIEFGIFSTISTGLESTKSRYPVIIFDMHSPLPSSSLQYLRTSNTDKSITQFKLSFKDKLAASELMNSISNMNKEMAKSTSHESIESVKESQPNNWSKETISTRSLSLYSSTGTSYSDNYKHKDEVNAPKTLRFGEDIIIKEEKLKSLHYTWMWFEFDSYLTTEYDFTSYNDDIEPIFVKNHSVVQINQLISSKVASRVFYNNTLRKNRKTNDITIS